MTSLIRTSFVEVKFSGGKRLEDEELDVEDLLLVDLCPVVLEDVD